MVSALGTRTLRVLALVALVLGAGVAAAAPGIGQTEPDLGTAEDFAVLAGTGITEDPGVIPPLGSDITGDVGVSPASGTTITGLTCSNVDGTIYTVDAAGPGGSCHEPNSEPVLTQAKADLTAAYVELTAQVAVATEVPSELDGQNLGPGVYDSADTTFLLSANGTLTLTGDADDVWIFLALADQAGALTVGTGSEIILVGGAQACNVWWAVTGATIGAEAEFVGSILAATSITVGDDTTIDGRLLAQTGNVTLINDTIIVPVCEVDDGNGDGGNGDGGNGDGGNGDGGNGDGGNGDGGNGDGGNGGGGNGTPGTPGDDTSDQSALTAALTAELLASAVQSSDVGPQALSVQPDLLG